MALRLHVVPPASGACFARLLDRPSKGTDNNQIAVTKSVRESLTFLREVQSGIRTRLYHVLSQAFTANDWVHRPQGWTGQHDARPYLGSKMESRVHSGPALGSPHSATDSIRTTQWVLCRRPAANSARTSNTWSENPPTLRMSSRSVA
jgi:hypothetical protein